MTNTVGEQQPQANGIFADYVAITRLDHVTKHVLIVPGAVVLLRCVPPTRCC